MLNSTIPEPVTRITNEAVDDVMFRPERWNVFFNYAKEPSKPKDYVQIMFENEPVSYLGQVVVTLGAGADVDIDAISHRIYDTVRDVRLSFISDHFDEVQLHGRTVKYLMQRQSVTLYCTVCQTDASFKRLYAPSSFHHTTELYNEHESETIARGCVALGHKGCWKHIDEFSQPKDLSV